MLAKIIILSLLATAVVSSPIIPDDEEDIPVYTEKVVPAKPTQAARVPKFGAKKVASSPRKLPEKAHLQSKRPYAPPSQTTSLPKALLKTTKPIRSNSRPVRRTAHAANNAIIGNGIIGYKPALRGDYNAPKPSYARAPALGVEYAPEVVPPSYDSPALIDDYQPRRIHHQSAPEYGAAVGNAPELRYAAAPKRIAVAAAEVRDVPDHGYNANAYDEKPQPYIFGYELKDESGSTQNRKEQGDDYGNKRGSYGYTDGYGIYRQVDYVADAHGFRAIIKTNEPGTDNQDPADVEMHSEAAKY